MKPPPALTPAPLSADLIREMLPAGRFGHPLFYFPAVDSTNGTLRELARRGAGEGTTVVAEQQFRGRGRRGRQWFSPAGGGIYLSLLARPKLSPTKCTGITLLTAAAVGRAIENLTGLIVEIKWPNDLLLEGRKVCGILAESGGDGGNSGEKRYLILGIGINVGGDYFPPDLENQAISLRMAGAKNLDRAELISKILGELEIFYEDFKAGGDLSPVLDFCRLRSATIGRRVRAIGAGGEISGLALNLEEDGGLRIQRNNGEHLIVHSGEVTLSPTG